MAKSPKKPAAEAGAAGAGDESQVPPKAESPKAPAKKAAVKLETVDIVLKRDMQVGDIQRKAGDKLATVVLEADVSLGYLARAVHDDIAGPAPAAE